MNRTVILLLFTLFAGSLCAKNNRALKVLNNARRMINLGHCEDGVALLNKYDYLFGDTSGTAYFLKAKCAYDSQRFESARNYVMSYGLLKVDTAGNDYREMKELADKLSINFGHRDTSGLQGGGFTEQQTWDRATRSNDVKAYRNYIRFYPSGPHIDEAKKVVDYYDTKENSPSRLIVEAVKNSDWKLITELVNKGADVNNAETHKVTTTKPGGDAVYEYYFEMPISLALLKFDYTMAKYFLEHGADPNRFVYRRVNNHEKLPERSRTLLENMIIATSKNGIYKGQDSRLIDFIDLMLKYGLDVNFYEGSPIATAVFYHDPKNYKRYTLIRYLMRKGADPYLHGSGDNDKSAVQIATERNDQALLSILKDKRYKELRKTLQDAKKKAPPAKSVAE